MTDQRPTLRERRRIETQRAIQAHAVRLFTERGYDATTVTEVAEAAGVSTMTVYRHFPTKEDLVLVDQHGRLIAERIAASAVGQPLVHRVGRALIDSARTLTGGRESDTNRQFLLATLRLMISTPALRARHLDSHYALQLAIVEALGCAGDRESVFRAHAVASACLAAMHTATVRWAEDDGRTDLAALIAQALAAAFGAEAVAEAPSAE